jgi:hypothetical protein
MSYKNANNKIIFGFYKVNNPQIINGHPQIHIGINKYNIKYRYGFIINKQIQIVRHYYLINEPIIKCEFNKKYMIKQDIDYLILIKIFN